MPFSTDDRTEKGRAPVRGWLLVFCALLLIWQPLSFALLASTMIGRLPTRGLPLALILLTRVVSVGFGIAAGLTLLARRSGGVTLAKISVTVTALLDLFVYATPYFPTNLPPGDAPIYAAASMAYAAVWLVYLSRSKRVRALR